MRREHSIQLLSVVLLIAMVAVYRPVCLWAEDLGGAVLRDYPVSLPLPERRLEAGFDFLMLYSGMDPLGFVEENNRDVLLGSGELNGLCLKINYGLSRRVTLKSGVQYKDMEFGTDRLAVKGFDLGCKYSLVNQRDPRIPKIALDVGGRLNWADDAVVNIADATADNGQGTLFIQDASDWSAAARLTVGRVAGRFFPNAYVQYGFGQVRGDAALTDAGSGPPVEGLLSFAPRDEHTLRAGLSLLVKFPYRALLHLEYQYVHILRDKELEQVGDNNILKADFNYYVTPVWIINVGGIYFDKHLNGELPLLYNELTQPGFDRYYGYFWVGLTYLFDL